MSEKKTSKVIIDTNVWISFLIGKDLLILKSLILDKRVKLIITDQLIEEIKLVTLRDKLRKYFDPERVQELISLIEIISDNIKIEKIEKICRDPKDDFLLALAKKSKADYLVTGDIDLLGIKLYNKTKIITAKTFESFFK